jgi:hypothetical protein
MLLMGTHAAGAQRMQRQQEDWSDGPLSVRSNRYGEDVIVVSLGGELDRSNVATAKAAVFAAARASAGWW